MACLVDCSGDFEGGRGFAAVVSAVSTGIPALAEACLAVSVDGSAHGEAIVNIGSLTVEVVRSTNTLDGITIE